MFRMSRSEQTVRFIKHIPPGGAVASNGCVLTKKMVTKAIAKKAKSLGFSATTVRTTTVLCHEAINEYAEEMARSRQSSDVQLGPGEMVEQMIENLQNKIRELEANNADLVSRNNFLRHRPDLPLSQIVNLVRRVEVLDRLDRFEAVYAAFDEAREDVARVLNNIAAGRDPDPADSAKWALTRMEKLLDAMLRVRPVQPQ